MTGDGTSIVLDFLRTNGRSPYKAVRARYLGDADPLNPGAIADFDRLILDLIARGAVAYALSADYPRDVTASPLAELWLTPPPPPPEG